MAEEVVAVVVIVRARGIVAHITVKNFARESPVMQRETTCVRSMYNQRTFAFHGHLTHLPASQKPKLRWFVYLLEDLACMLQYVGSTSDVCRWSST